MTEPTAEVVAVVELAAADRDAVTALAAAAESTDGSVPIDDQVRLDLDHGTAGERTHLLARDGSGRLIGYAHLDVRSDDAASAHLVVAPEHRRAGVGGALVARLDAMTADHGLRAWAHGNGAPAAAFAERLGWPPVRELRRMRLPRTAAVADPVTPSDVSIRTFAPGLDEDAWVAVNSAAFAHHPEQGRVTADDLRQREEQPWFDPNGFFVAERAGTMVGFHWTKVHRHSDGDVGEVYVVGVDPSEQGSGLGKALTLIGLHYLRDNGLDVILHVDADNAAAVALYDRLGFEIDKVDVMYERPHPGGAAG